MKKRFVLMAMFAVVLAFGFVLVGCGGDDDGGTPAGGGGGLLANSISGTTWVYTSSEGGTITLEFTDTVSGKYTVDENGDTGDFTYIYADSAGTFSPDTWTEDEVKSSAFIVDTTAKTFQLTTKAFYADNPAIYHLVE
ncbi:hypothetical protein AGMMS49940_04730 [Spirochaetia bacterium]|nr:hypothetical protein AGMMS49940_04730 [Spirochaetia bacterium]